MKSSKIITALSGLAISALLLNACSKTVEPIADEIKDFSNLARLQVYNASVGNQRNHVYVDGIPVTGSSLIYTNTSFAPNFPTTGASFIVNPGLRNFVIKDTLTTTTQPALSFAVNFEPTKFYTIFAYDTMTSIKQKTVETEIVVPTDNTARIRFANFVFNKIGTPPNVDIFSKVKNANIFTNIPMAEVTGFIPYQPDVTDSLIVRSTVGGVALDTAVFTFRATRSYTLVFRGRYESNGSGGATFPRTLSSFTNY